MLDRTFCSIGFAALLLTAPVVAGTYSAPATQADASALHRGQRHHGQFRLAPELKIMWRKEERPRLKAMPREQRHGWFRARWAAMNEKERQAKTAELVAKWKALPENVRQTLMERKHQKWEGRRLRRGQRRNDARQDPQHT